MPLLSLLGLNRCPRHLSLSQRIIFVLVNDDNKICKKIIDNYYLLQA